MNEARTNPYHHLNPPNDIEPEGSDTNQKARMPAAEEIFHRKRPNAAFFPISPASVSWADWA